MERIGEYLVRRLVGEGGMGKVYEAEERLSKRRVALKVLRDELARSEEGRRLFLNEMTILAHVDHPNVVRCLACQEVDDQLVMVLEFLEGQTLREVLADRGRLPWTEAVTIACKIAAGLSAAHAQEPAIVHRDLKPENVIVLTDGRVKVTDFGIAKVLAALSRTTTHSIGTLQYMSPEQIDATEIGPWTDLYALGLVLYELLSGRPPFESASPRELLNLQCSEPPPPLPDDVRRGLPKGVERVLTSLLAKKPDERPQSALEVIEALEPFSAADDLAPVATAVARTTTVGAGEGAARPVVMRPVEVKPAPIAADTVGLLRTATGPRQMSAPVGLGIVLLLSVLAGAVTYFVRSGTADGAGPRAEDPTVAASAEP
jgi:serine/threonine-protein kinase